MKQISFFRMVAITITAMVIYSFSFRSNEPVSTSTLNPTDYQYYFILNKQIRDVRNFEVVNDKMVKTPQSLISYSKDKKSLWVENHDTHTYSSYSLTGTPLHTFQLKKEALSPDWTHKVYIKNNDLWAADINWKTGTTSNDRQITFLGTFSPMYGIGYSHWYKDKLLTMISGKCYVINTSNGDIRELVPDNDRYCLKDFSYHVSPESGRYIYNIDRIIDLETLDSRKATVGRVPHYYWKNENEITMVSSNLMGVVVDMRTGNYKEAFETKLLDIHSLGDSQKANRSKKSKWVSPSGKYVLFLERLNGGNFIWVGDSETGVRIQTNIKIDKPQFQHNYNLNFKWTSDGSFIYANQGDPITQGTWFYDIHRKAKKKITPQIAKKIVVLKDAGKVVFIANNNVFSADLDGNNLKQLTSQPLGQREQHLADFIR